MKWTKENLIKFLKKETKQSYVIDSRVIDDNDMRAYMVVCVDNDISVCMTDREELHHTTIKFDSLSLQNKNYIYLECLGAYKQYNSQDDEYKSFSSERAGTPAIARDDFHSFPAGMAAELFDDKQMQEVAEYAYELYDGDLADFDSEDDDILSSAWEEFYRVIECAGVRCGMLYYEDMAEDTYKKLIES